MPITTRHDAPEFAQDGFTIRALMAPSRGSQELALWTIDAAPGACSAAHSLSREEVFLLQHGTLEVTLDGTRHALHAGDALAVPPGTVLQLQNAGGKPAQLVACASAELQATVAEQTFAPPWTR